MRVAFTLTFWQRVLNPPERLLLFALSVGAPAVPLVISVVSLDLELAAMAAAGLALFVLMFWRNNWAFVHVVRGQYIDTLDVSAEHLCFGRGQLEVAVERWFPLRVDRGLCGCSIVRDVTRGAAVVVPTNAVSLADLRRAVAVEA